MIKVSDHQIEAIESVYRIKGEKLDWWQEDLNLLSVWEQSTGKGIKVGVIDTGIDHMHPDLRNKIQGTWGIDGHANDDNGHGSHVAGIIGAENNGSGMIGMAPDCMIYAAKTMNEKGQGSIDSLRDAIEWCVKEGCTILNLSLGTRSLAPMHVQKIIDECIRQNIWIVAAAGNDHLELAWPASDPDVLAVGAISKTKEIAGFSNYGKWMDLSMPGVSILSTYCHQRYARLSGTSMAAPIVTGALALYRSMYPNASFDTMFDSLKNSCTDLGTTGFDPVYGYGMMNVKEFLRK